MSMIEIGRVSTLTMTKLPNNIEPDGMRWIDPSCPVDHPVILFGDTLQASNCWEEQVSE